MDKEFYLLYSRLERHQNVLTRSKKLIETVVAECQRPYVAASFGKDSLCLLHMAAGIKPYIDAIYVRCGEFDDWPDIDRVIDEFVARYPVTLHETKAMSIVECYRKVGQFYIYPDTPEKKRADAEYARSFMNAIKTKAQGLGCDCALVGLRKEESKRRRILLNTRGNDMYAKSNRIREVFPLSDWTGRDVWAYIYANDIPYPNLYDLSDDRERARNGAMFAANIQRRGAELHYAGQLALLKKMYPDLFARFAAEFPDVRLYV